MRRKIIVKIKRSIKTILKNIEMENNVLLKILATFSVTL